MAGADGDGSGLTRRRFLGRAGAAAALAAFAAAGWEVAGERLLGGAAPGLTPARGRTWVALLEAVRGTEGIPLSPRAGERGQARLAEVLDGLSPAARRFADGILDELEAALPGGFSRRPVDARRYALAVWRTAPSVPGPAARDLAGGVNAYLQRTARLIAAAPRPPAAPGALLPAEPLGRVDFAVAGPASSAGRRLLAERALFLAGLPFAPDPLEAGRAATTLRLAT